MARRKLTDVSHPDPLLTDEYWLEFGDDPQPPMRLKILYVTFGVVKDSGPASFNVATVCDRLGITYPMVNHYFGSRDGLLAEGTLMVYRRYVDALWEAVQRAPAEPEARLKAWMMEQVEETAALGGWAPILNYPLAAREVTIVIQAKFQQALNRLFELNLARLGAMVLDVRRGTVSDIGFTEDYYPKQEFLDDAFLQSVLPTVSWSIFGMAVWRGGQHAPASRIPEILGMFDDLADQHFATLIHLIKTRAV